MSVSLKNIAAEVKQNNETAHTSPTPSATANAANKQQVVMNEPVTQEQIQKNWIRYARSIEEENPRLYSMMYNQKPELRNGTQVVLKIKNQTQESEISKERQAIFRFLRNELRNSSLELVVEMEADDVHTDIAYTAADKFKKMVDKNPELLKLKQQFGLDIE